MCPSSRRRRDGSFPIPAAGDDEIVAVGGDLEPGTVLDAYRRGLFPMRADGLLAWWSPDPRGVIPLDGFHVSRSLRSAIPRFEIRVDTAFEAVMRGCADPQPSARLDRRVVRRRVHATARAGLGAQRRDVARRRAASAGSTALRIGGLFAGESMFHRVTDASKVACWATVELLRLDGVRAVRRAVDDAAPASLGAVDVTPGRVPRLLVGQRRRGRVSRMSDVTIFHNPSCSKSRGALEILEERGVDADVVRYLDTPPDRATLERILDAIPDEPSALVRTDDDKFKALGIPKADVQTREQVIDVLLEHPEVMERPVVFVGDRAVIARPSEKVLDLLD